MMATVSSEHLSSLIHFLLFSCSTCPDTISKMREAKHTKTLHFTTSFKNKSNDANKSKTLSLHAQRHRHHFLLMCVQASSIFFFLVALPAQLLCPKMWLSQTYIRTIQMYGYICNLLKTKTDVALQELCLYSAEFVMLVTETSVF